MHSEQDAPATKEDLVLSDSRITLPCPWGVLQLRMLPITEVFDQSLSCGLLGAWRHCCCPQASSLRSFSTCIFPTIIMSAEQLGHSDAEVQ